MARRWWVIAPIAALLAAMMIAAVHAAAVDNSGLRSGQAYELTVRLSAPARNHSGMTGPWWTSRGTIVAGADRSTVSVVGSGEQSYQTGDRLTGLMQVDETDTPGDAARLRVRGDPVLTPADSVFARIRGVMRTVAGPTDPGWLLSGMTLGMDQGLSEPAAQAMRSAGLSHLTAVSGANCVILVIVVLWVCGWLRVPRLARVMIAVAVLLGFVAVVGAQPSVLRAAVMTVLTLIASLVGGRRAGAHVLQVSVLLLLMVDPWLAYSVGFMLSIAATAGLIAVIDRGLLAATVAAQVATLPIIVAIGGSFGLRTVMANVLVTPLTAVIPVLGLSSIVAQSVAGVGQPVAAVGRILTAMVLRIAHISFPDPVLWLPGAAGVGLALLVTVVAFTLGRRRIVAVAAVLVMAISVTVRAADGWPPRDWWMVACDVGQGDALVVRSDSGTLVVDVGPDGQAIDACLDRLGVQSVDLLVLTHFHADHVDGLPGLLSGRRIGQVWVSPCGQPPEQFDEAMAQLESLPVSIPRPGSQYSIGDTRLEVIWPQRIISAGSIPNNASVSFMLVAPQGRIALLADLEAEAQAAVLRDADVRADIAKVPHHGSANFDPQLPAAVDPEVAVISVGADNTFGHPTQQALQAWQSTGAVVFTTMDNGDIAIRRDARVVVRGVSR